MVSGGGGGAEHSPPIPQDVRRCERAERAVNSETRCFQPGRNASFSHFRPPEKSRRRVRIDRRGSRDGTKKATASSWRGVERGTAV